MSLNTSLYMRDVTSRIILVPKDIRNIFFSEYRKGMLCV